jgi:succinate dehydrogenase / fumarate reductase cytochrome b subunit
MILTNHFDGDRIWGIQMTRKTNTSRPQFFTLTQVQMPVGALTSIAHRISGILLALSVPFGIYLLKLSLQSPEGYEQAANLVSRWEVKILAILFIWSLTHHLLAGVRHLLNDIDIGSHLVAARRSAWIVNCSGALITLLSVGAFL